MLNETIVGEQPDMASFPVSQQQLNNAMYWRRRDREERDWYAGWTVRMSQALAIVREQMGRR